MPGGIAIGRWVSNFLRAAARRLVLELGLENVPQLMSSERAIGLVLNGYREGFKHAGWIWSVIFIVIEVVRWAL